MRAILLLLPIIAVTGCAESVRGPRLVDYNSGRFSIRYLPARSSAATVEQMASDRCAEVGGTARLERSNQFLWSDLRDNIYRCTKAKA